LNEAFNGRFFSDMRRHVSFIADGRFFATRVREPDERSTAGRLGAGPPTTIE
jgi:hypothetical protein